MKTCKMRNFRRDHIRNALGAAVICTLVPLAAQADPTKSPTCNALVTVANDLYLASVTGQEIAQFTADGAPKGAATLAPDGSRVAYAFQGNVANYEVVDSMGRGGVFPLVAPLSGSLASATGDVYANSPLIGLRWNSSRVLTVIKHVGPQSSRFEFIGIPQDLAPPAQWAGSPAYGANCAQGNGVGQIACVTQAGEVTVSSGASGANAVFSVTGFEGVAPEESLTLSVGGTGITQVIPGYKIQVLNITPYGIDLKVTLPVGTWEESVISAGAGLTVPAGPGRNFGFFPTIVDQQVGIVRVDVRLQDSGTSVLDPAVAWVTDGTGLLLIRRTRSQAFLYLITPGSGDQHWQLAAEAPFNISNVIKAMHFIGSSLLQLEDVSGNIVTYAIGISHGASAQNPETLTLGAVTPLPTALELTINGTSVHASVVDWGCQIQGSGK